LLERADFLVTSDHGEEFLQHNDWEHGRNLHNEETRIPLVAFGPSFARRGRVEVPVQLLDVMPTVLDMFDLPTPYELHGESLMPILRAGTAGDRPETLRHRKIYGSNHNYRIEYKVLEYSVIEDGRWKLVLGAAPTGMYRGGPKSRFMLFDVSGDPRERLNAVYVRQDISRRLIEDVIRWRSAQHVYMPGRRGPTLIDSEHMRQLKAMGYVDTEHGTAPRDTGTTDPE